MSATEQKRFNQRAAGIVLAVALVAIVALGVAYYVKNKKDGDVASDLTPREQAIELYGDNKYDEALVQVDAALNEDPNSSENYNFKANILRDKGDYAAATENYNRAIELNPNVLAPYVNAAHMYLNQGDKASAAAIVERGLAVFPNQKSLLELKEQAK